MNPIDTLLNNQRASVLDRTKQALIALLNGLNRDDKTDAYPAKLLETVLHGTHLDGDIVGDMASQLYHAGFLFTLDMDDNGRIAATVYESFTTVVVETERDMTIPQTTELLTPEAHADWLRERLDARHEQHLSALYYEGLYALCDKNATEKQVHQHNEQARLALVSVLKSYGYTANRRGTANHGDPVTRETLHAINREAHERDFDLNVRLLGIDRNKDRLVMKASRPLATGYSA